VCVQPLLQVAGGFCCSCSVVMAGVACECALILSLAALAKAKQGMRMRPPRVRDLVLLLHGR
jgi:hypothetical protein